MPEKEMDMKKLKKLTDDLVKDVKKTQAFLSDPNKVAKEYGIKFDKEEEEIIKESGKVTKQGIGLALAIHRTKERPKPKPKPKWGSVTT